MYKEKEEKYILKINLFQKKEKTFKEVWFTRLTIKGQLLLPQFSTEKRSALILNEKDKNYIIEQLNSMQSIEAKILKIHEIKI